MMMSISCGTCLARILQMEIHSTMEPFLAMRSPLVMMGMYSQRLRRALGMQIVISKRHPLMRQGHIMCV